MLNVLLASCALIAGSNDAGAEADSVELSYKTYRNWAIQLPEEQFSPVSGGIPLPHAGGDAFAAELDGTRLVIDSDGDGTTDLTVEGKEIENVGRFAMVTLRGEDESGSDLTYSVRLRSLAAGDTGWHFASSGAMVGKINGVKVQLIDQNNNGRYADYGEDAMVVGRGKSACYLSRAVSIGGDVLRIDVAEDGSRIDYEPWDGEVGELDLNTGRKGNAKLLSAVVRSLDRELSFDLSRASDGLPVPAGRYEIVAGKIGLGEGVVHVRAGRTHRAAVKADERTVLEWGGPVTAEFKFQRRGDEIAFFPDDVWYFGAAGEEYFGFKPFGASPEFTVKDRETGEVVETAIFGGC